MAVRKKLIDRVAEQIAAIPNDRFIVLDVTNALVSCNGKTLATNAEVTAIMRCYGMARNTGILIKRGDCNFTVWEKTGGSHAHSGGKGNHGGGVKA